MQRVLANVVVVECQGNGPYRRIVMRAPQIARSLSAGRFVMADLGGILREPLYPARVAPDEFDVLALPGHAAEGLRAGTNVDLIGPLGRGFEVPMATRRLLLAADSAHLPVLLPLVSPRTGAAPAVSLIVSADDPGDLYPLRLLPPAVEVHVARMDGPSRARDRFLPLFSELVVWADHVCVATDPGWYAEMAGAVRRHRLSPPSRFAEALASTAMACGVGACQCCAVDTTRGLRLACVDGPVFSLLEFQSR